jgi:hypothetical protein
VVLNTNRLIEWWGFLKLKLKLRFLDKFNKLNFLYFYDYIKQLLNKKEAFKKQYLPYEYSRDYENINIFGGIYSNEDK